MIPYLGKELGQTLAKACPGLKLAPASQKLFQTTAVLLGTSILSSGLWSLWRILLSSSPCVTGWIPGQSTPLPLLRSVLLSTHLSLTAPGQKNVYLEHVFPAVSPLPHIPRQTDCPPCLKLGFRVVLFQCCLWSTPAWKEVVLGKWLS